MFTFSLKDFNTFKLNIFAELLILAKTPEIVLNAWQFSQLTNKPFLLLGNGSNILFLNNFSGTVVINRIKGIEYKETLEYWYIHVGAGENWHELIKQTLRKGIFGLENLAMIPGLTGAAPIQNIGAYGLEFQDVCNYVDLLNLQRGKIKRIYCNECDFHYRSSIFKNICKKNFLVTSVGLKLKKKWKPILSYESLNYLCSKTVTAHDIYQKICQIRNKKLPDYRFIGNVGSFFKNPLVNTDTFKSLSALWPEIPYWLIRDNFAKIKISAAWLIEQCNLKGFSYGDAEVYKHQALVLINKNNATPKDIIKLAQHVRQTVGNRFNIWLEPEVTFIGMKGEVNALEVLCDRL
ncbi:UDP-N-acetylmuramate dehydrogenase [Candidatus Ishikawella capsulata]|uniref:UDP-N-acetylenolpyruvoylglucosamine reductase n=1 Tax=Candidatus Ishikawaella capsulata Mpkobe TaxID=476281 RepID=C5WDH5_9ENTR|nr:UDP-N-acetylmuramate dehydrogenase [Candidatus Ishikawaella capsulata]BAH83381.1 UDP-N-acetylenolpyruvoylglucosamine reductase [Candidatus Ishikawaella capsulata Mpkobe]